MAAATEYELMVWKSEYNEYLRKKSRYDDDKVRVFLLVLGQCTLSLRHKIEQSDDFQQMEKDFNVIGLMNRIKKICYVSPRNRYGYWAMAVEFKRLANIKQQPDEALSMYYKRFVTLVSVIETRWGHMAPGYVLDDENGLQKIDPAETSTMLEGREKFLTCVFMDGAHRGKYSKCIADLNNSYLSG